MARDYWLQRNGKTTGPFSDDQLKQMAAAGMIAEADRVSEDQVNWVEVEAFLKLLVEDGSPRECPEAEPTVSAAKTTSGEAACVPGGPERTDPLIARSVTEGAASASSSRQSERTDVRRPPAQRPDCSFHEAVGVRRDIEQAKLHLARGIDVNVRRYGVTPLHEAAQFASSDIPGGLDMVEFLLANNADVNAKGRDDMTPLHIAAQRGNRGLAEFLLANKADVNAKAWSDKTPLHIAVMDGQGELAELLLSFGAKVNAVDEDGCTPLFYAGRSGDIVEMLLRGGAGYAVSVRDRFGHTPLHYFVTGNAIDAAQVLLKDNVSILEEFPGFKGIDLMLVNASNKRGKTALELADKDSEMAELLRSYGAERSPVWHRGPLTPKIMEGVFAGLFFCGFLLVVGVLVVGLSCPWWAFPACFAGGFLAVVTGLLK